MPETATPETEVIDEMETPVEISQEEETDARYSYDLPRNDEADSSGGSTEEITSADDPSSAPEQEGQSEIPGDPRDPHQTQPPFKEEY